MSARGFVIAAPTSGAGKTTVTLGLLRALKRRGIDIRAAKSGPDYIDPAFHEAACGSPSVNLDAWAMPPDALRGRAAAQGGALLLVEGAMGVLDAGRDGRGSAADLAEILGLPVVLVLDVAKSGQSALLPAVGLQSLRPKLPLAGVILNRAGTESHAELAAKPLAAAKVPVFGALLRDTALHLPERHLGLVQAAETEGLDTFLEHAADRVEAAIDLDALVGAAQPLASAGDLGGFPRLTPPGQRIAVAADPAFAFAYPHLLADWRAQGAEILPFSPLDDEGPAPLADSVFLPGGYPELFAGQLAAASRFHALMRAAVDRGALIYGECGGFMVLGEGLVDAEGTRHEMLGLLPHSTSFRQRRLTLGYRRLSPLPGAPWSATLLGHEFHYATIQSEGAADRLFEATDAAGTRLAPMGLHIGRVSGSFAHVIGPA
ncbi:cobyrinate a,c-diamide synthase [Tropicimonas sp. IMCC6043]|uniref:cobyrinate a,c-diamide synthase n=1 Tax=Tropicimonas sp. IMCC6043 TaxID=2510645 RepID=UPI00101C56BB|nr:cobyrinate a,c-diamide synthase [Tropicimonas sp. IMCC6043]RYH11649.1 cobyrinate a,c-diamide synthase [Tropicimonas sp. IMCC6043]